jgi:1-acyl-sn-glycerol-3-phosphate acyltransferase
VPPREELPAVLRQRDPNAIRQLFPRIAWIADRYFRSEVEGVEHLTEDRSLLVATHNGGLYMPDMLCFITAFWRRFGLETPAYGLAHEFVFRIPVFGTMARQLGAISARRECAHAALDAGHPLLICPGGDVDALKPFRDRHRVTFGGRRGFIRLAIEKQVPIVPIVSVGAHETFFVLNDGRKTAEWTGLARFLRIKTVPLALSFPFGLTPAGLFALPLPSKVKVQILPRIELAEPPSAARDDRVVERCCHHVRSTMQHAINQLAAASRRVVLG